jgi:hypothetical protein
MFAQNPLQEQQQQQQRDVELGSRSAKQKQKTKKQKQKMKRRGTKTSTKINILNNVEHMSSSRVVEIRDMQECQANILEGLQKAKKVKGLDGADNVFNQAVRASLDLHNVSAWVPWCRVQP